MGHRHHRRGDLFGDRTGRLRHPTGERVEVHRLEEGDEADTVDRRHRQFLDRGGDRHVAVERHQFQRDPRLIRMFDQRFAPFRLFDLAGAGKQRREVAELADQRRGGLDTDARHPRHVVDRITGECLDVDHLVGGDAELLDHLGLADAPVLHRVEHDHARLDQLHQVLVGGDDGDVGAGRSRLRRVGGDEIVGLESALFDAGDVEGARRLADQAELRTQVLRCFGAMGLVVGIERVAEGRPRSVEDHRQMGRLDRGAGLLRLLQQAIEHVAEAGDGADRQAVRLAGERRQRVIGAEDVGRAVDQEEVVAGPDRTRVSAIGQSGDHGRHLTGAGAGNKRRSPPSPVTMPAPVSRHPELGHHPRRHVVEVMAV